MLLISTIKYNIMNTMFQKKAMRRWTWKSLTKTKLDYILTNRPDIVTDVTIINQVNTGSDHRMDIKQHQIGRRGGKVEQATNIRYQTNRIKDDRILELRNRFERLRSCVRDCACVRLCVCVITCVLFQFQ